MCMFTFPQTKIFEVLQLKEEAAEKLWVSDECMVLDAVRRVSLCLCTACLHRHRRIRMRHSSQKHCTKRHAPSLLLLHHKPH